MPGVVQEMSAHSAPPRKAGHKFPVCTNGCLIIATIKETISSLSLLSLTRNFAKSVGIVADFIVINDLNAKEEKILQCVQCLMTFPISYTAITLLDNNIQPSFRKEE